MTDTDQIVLDIGGKVFKASRTTLRFSGSRYFKGRFTTGTTLTQDCDSSAPIFIDRDGSLFDEILFFMRTQNLRAKTQLTATTLVDLVGEAEFYGYDALKEACESALLQLKLSIVKNTQLRPCNAKFYALIVTATSYKRLRIPEGAILYVASATIGGRCRVDRYRRNPNVPDIAIPGCFLNTHASRDTGDFQLFLCPTGSPREKAFCIAHVGMDHIHVGSKPVDFDFRHDLRLTVSPTSEERKILLGVTGSGEWHVSCWVGRPDEIPGLGSPPSAAAAALPSPPTSKLC
ncbi:MAG: hypothetical protein SGARI_000559 [Bacillariaceae sp.]